MKSNDFNKNFKEFRVNVRSNLQYLKAPLFIYTIKCLLGLSIGYWLYIRFPQHQFFWTLLSIILVLAPDHKHSTKLAFDRMKANTIGSLTGLLLFITHGPPLLLLAAGVVVTIAVCSLLHLMAVGRTALAALLIVMIYEKSGNTWQVALERMGCVIVGCFIALFISFIFGYITKE